MAIFKKGIKGILIKSMEVVGNAASNIASNTKYKLDEMTIINRRREILSDFGAKAYEIWQKGASFPDELEADLQELCELDIRLNELRMEKLSNVETKTAPAQEKAEPTTTATSTEIPASDAIDALFEQQEKTKQDSDSFGEFADAPMIELEEKFPVEESSDEDMD